MLEWYQEQRRRGVPVEVIKEYKPCWGLLLNYMNTSYRRRGPVIPTLVNDLSKWYHQYHIGPRTVDRYFVQLYEMAEWAMAQRYIEAGYSELRAEVWGMIRREYESYLRANGRSEATISTYNTHLNHFCDWLWSRGYMSLKTIGARHFEDFMLYLQQTPANRRNPHSCTKDEPIKPATRLAYWRTLHAFMEFCVKRGYLPQNHMDDVTRPHVPEQPLELYTPSEYRNILHWFLKRRGCATNLRDYTYFRFLFDTGAREMEAARLRASAIDFENRAATVWGKQGRSRRVPIGVKTAKALHALIERNNGNIWAFPSRYGEPMATSTIWEMMKEACAGAGVPPRKELVHAIRHTAACNMLRASGGDLNYCRLVLGHSNFETTMRYARHLEHERVLEQHARFGPGDNLL